MPIKVTCKCGAAFAAPDNLAGKSVKCPKCAAPLAIPGGVASAANKPATNPAAKPTKPAANTNPVKPAARPSQKPSPPVSGGLGDLLDEVGITSHAGPRCPSCSQPMPPGAMLCVNCGFNAQTGMAVGAGFSGKKHLGHGEAADSILRRAEAEIAATPIATRSFDAGTGKSLWTWVLLPFIPVLMAIAFAIVVFWGGNLMFPFRVLWFSISEGKYEWFPAALVYAIGLVVMMAGWWAVTSVAIEDNLIQGLACLLTLNIYAPIYGAAHFQKCRHGFGMNMAGIFILNIAQAMFIATALWLANMPILIVPLSITVIGTLTIGFGGIMIALEAFEERPLYGYLCCLVPLFFVVWGFVRLQKCWKWQAVVIGGFVGMGVAGSIFFFFITHFNYDAFQKAMTISA